MTAINLHEIDEDIKIVPVDEVIKNEDVTEKPKQKFPFPFILLYTTLIRFIT